jgi:cytochrome c
LANADPVKGQDVFVSNCRDCHTTEENSATRTGPPLWGVVGRAKASLPNVNYSQSLLQWGGTWTFEDLNLFLTAPMAAVPGVKMDFPGLADESDRADVIAYLRSRSNDPVPLP